MLFEYNIPDPHMGVYSETILGRSGDIQLEPNEIGWKVFTNTWFAGYYLKGPNNNNSLTEQMLFNNILSESITDNYILFHDFNLESDSKGWFYHFFLGGWYYLSVLLKFNSNKDGIWVWSEKLGSNSTGKKDIIGLNSGWQWHNRYWCIQNYIFGYDGLNITNFTGANTEYWLKQALSLNKVDYTETNDPYVYSDKMCNSNDVSTGDGVLFWVDADTYGSNWMLMRPYMQYNNATEQFTGVEGYYYFYKINSSPYYEYFK